MAEMTINDRIKYLGALPSPEDNRDYRFKDVFPAAAAKLPEEYTSDNLPPFVLDQGQSNMCVACSLAYIRYMQEIKQSRNTEKFSALYIYGNRDAGMYSGEGMYPREALKTLQKYGVCHDKYLSGYTDAQEARRRYKANKTELDAKAEPFRIDSYYACNTVNEIKTAVMRTGAVTVDLPVYDALCNPDPNGNVKANIGGTLYGYHEMTIVGWTKDNKWKMLNSWGNSWGKNGMCFVPFEYRACEAWAIIDNIMEVFMFKDVAENHWAKAVIDKAAAKGVMGGYTDGTFRPDEPLTRAQLVAILDRLGLLGK